MNARNDEYTSATQYSSRGNLPSKVFRLFALFSSTYVTMATRSSNSKLKLILESPGEDHLVITGRKLPTYKQVLLCFLAHSEKCRREDSSKNKRIGHTAASAVIEQITFHYNNAGIFAIPKKNLYNQILSLHQKYISLRKVNPSRRAVHHSLQVFQENLSRTMPLWPKDVMKKLIASKQGKTLCEKRAIDEDIAFLENMMSTRTGQYTSKDKITSKFIEMRQIRQREAEERAKKQNTSDSFLVIDEPYDSEMHNGDSEFNITAPTNHRRKHRRTIKTGVNLTIPFDILKNPKIVGNYTRNKISPTAISSFLRTLILECGEDPKAVNLHHSTAYR